MRATRSETPLERFQRRWRETHLSCEEVAALYLPEAWTVEYRKSLSGLCNFTHKIIKAPRPTTPDALKVFLHECAHAHLKHDIGRTPRHVEEMEAEQWAYAKMAEHHIPLSTKMAERGKRYVTRMIHKARRRGAKTIDPRAIAFAGDALMNALVWSWGGYAEVMNGLEKVGHYNINTVGPVDSTGAIYATSFVVEWKPKRGRAERVGVASTWRKACKMVQSDYKYRFPKPNSS